MGNKLVFGNQELVVDLAPKQKKLAIYQAIGTGLEKGELLAEMQFKSHYSARTIAAMINVIADTLESEEDDNWLSSVTESTTDLKEGGYV